jgi:hypothetical protein
VDVQILGVGVDGKNCPRFWKLPLNKTLCNFQGALGVGFANERQFHSLMIPALRRTAERS